MQETRVCTRCKKELPLRNFYSYGKRRTREGGLWFFRVCKKCGYNRKKQFYIDNPDRFRETKINRILRERGITRFIYDELYKRQKNRCAICRIKLLSFGKKNNSPCIDHNHKTGIVRGVLCRQCNRCLGLLKDDLRILKNAVKYLKKYE